jgi:hypothetical protein
LEGLEELEVVGKVGGVGKFTDLLAKAPYNVGENHKHLCSMSFGRMYSLFVIAKGNLNITSGKWEK